MTNAGQKTITTTPPSAADNQHSVDSQQPFADEWRAVTNLEAQMPNFWRSVELQQQHLQNTGVLS